MLNVGIGLVRDLDNKLVGNGKPTCTSNFPAGWFLQEQQYRLASRIQGRSRHHARERSQGGALSGS